VGRILRHVEALLAQSDEDARRLIAIGAPAGTVKVSGNLKFDIHVREAPFTTKLRDMMNTTGKPTVIVAGSTVEGEEELVLAAFRQGFARENPALLILAPRHPERFPAVAEMLCNSGLPYARRSELRGIENLSHGVLLLDSIGELASVYSLADVAFVGGSLVPRGGHNILEPALFGKPIVIGPYTDNFREIVEMFRREKAVFVAKDQQELAQLFHVLVTGDEGRDAGMRAAAVVQRNAGATQRTVDELAGILSRTAPVPEGVSR
jgi:3-deoxy-D-manno-octulosonic-acid transferase